MDLFITGEKVDIKPIGENDTDMVKRWYSEHGLYGFATGRKNIEEILQVSPGSFVSGIYTKDEILIGLIAGDFKNINEKVVWIRTFLIDAGWQRKKFGTFSFDLLCRHLAENYNVKRIYLSVPKKNRAGINFWIKMGMYCVKTVKNSEAEKNCEVLIFEKVL